VDTVLRSYEPALGVQKLDDLWTVWKRSQYLRCGLSTHRHGWELTLGQSNVVTRSRVCRTQVEVFDTSDDWRIEAIAGGWHTLT